LPLHPINISCIQLCKNVKLAKSYICHHIVKEVAHTFNLINFSSSFLWIDKICPVYTRIKNKQLSFVTRGYVVFKISNNLSTINHPMIRRIRLYMCLCSYVFISIYWYHRHIISWNIQCIWTSIFWNTLHHWFWFIYYFVWMTFLIFLILIIGENHIARDI